MSLRDRTPGTPPTGPSGPENDCMQLPLVARMAVDRPEGLAREPWASHLRTCALCRREASEHARGIALFRAVEGGTLANEESALTWETLVGEIEKQRAAEDERSRGRAWWGIPVAATAAGILAVAGVIGWDGLQDDAPGPARIVRVQPHAQHTMEQWMRRSLAPDEARESWLAETTGVGDPNVRPYGSAEASWALPDGRELAASVAPLEAPQEATPADPEAMAAAPDVISSEVIQPAEPILREGELPRASGRRPVIETLPAGNRVNLGQPLLRLEHHFAMPAQFTSFTPRD
jgi:hypothetical protein